MKQYTVEISKEALQDMEDIYDYIALNLLSPENAMMQYDRIAEAILSLNIFPERFRILDFDSEKTKMIRRMIVDNYSIFYVIKGTRVIVISILYSASNIDARLQDKSSTFS